MGANVPGSEDALRAVTAALTVDPGLPPVIAIDQEGGDVSRLPWDGFPSSLVLKDQPPAAARDAFAGRAALVQRAGIGVNFGVVADVTADRSMFIYRRALGTTPAAAAERVAAAVTGEGGAAASTLKHFPGHGSAPGDSHAGIPASGHVEGGLGSRRRDPVRGRHRRRCTAADVRSPRLPRHRPRARDALGRVAPDRPRRTGLHGRERHRRPRDAAVLGNRRLCRSRRQRRRGDRGGQRPGARGRLLDRRHRRPHGGRHRGRRRRPGSSRPSGSRRQRPASWHCACGSPPTGRGLVPCPACTPVE